MHQIINLSGSLTCSENAGGVEGRGGGECRKNSHTEPAPLPQEAAVCASSRLTCPSDVMVSVLFILTMQFFAIRYSDHIINRQQFTDIIDVYHRLHYF